MPLYRTSRLLTAAAVVHGFTGREGGVSVGPYASLNLGFGAGDDAAAVEQNFARLAQAAGLSGFATVSQVHGDRVLRASRAGPLREVFPESSAVPLAPHDGADVLLSLEPGVAVAVRAADCVPILLYAEDAGAVAAVHSGWKGTRLAVAGRAVRALQHEAAAEPARMLAAIGPCIGRCCYQVSPELASIFRGLFGVDVADDPEGPRKPHLDLRVCVERALLAAGVPIERIEQVGPCTSCDPTCFSHRRDRGLTGRQVGFIAAREPAHI